MSGKYALIIGNTEYADPGFAQLTAPGKDAIDFARVLEDPRLCGFDKVTPVINEISSKAKESIEEFFADRGKDDLLVLYFSGHGVKDENGNLYLAVLNTDRKKLRSTGIESVFIHDLADQSNSRKQVLILDCCNSGAFAKNTKSSIGESMGTASAFGHGSGQIILTATDSTQYAWDGDEIKEGKITNSPFTRHLIEGLKGNADENQDGQITVDDLYDYAHKMTRLENKKQTPSKFSRNQQGDIVIRVGVSTNITQGTRQLSYEMHYLIKKTMGAVKNLELEYKVDLSSFKNHLEKSAQGIDDILKIYHDAIKASSRESKLQQQIQELKIEIEKSKRNAQTAEIVDSEFFRDLNYKAKKMRESITKNKTNP